jgi:hypothetical protein
VCVSRFVVLWLVFCFFGGGFSSGLIIFGLLDTRQWIKSKNTLRLMLKSGCLITGARKTFGPKRKDVERDWRTLHNKELHVLYALPNIIRLIRSRRMRWVRHVARMEYEKCLQYFGWTT